LDLHATVLPVAEAERRLKALRFPEPRPPELHLRLDTAHRSGDIVLRTHDLAVGYADADAPLFRVPDLTLRRGECVALIGPNGAGKTTFLKTILGHQKPYAGQVELGAALKIGYFAQAAAQLDPRETVLQAILRAAPRLTPAEARDHLARYLFRGDDIAKPVQALSGGERSRLVLAQLALSGANFLLLDEPTNHLDIPAQEALQSLLADYPGTILLVSHDRYLIRALASQIWEIRPQAAALTVFLGDYEAYLAARETTPTGPRAKTPAPQKRTAPRREGLSKNQRRRIEREIAALEEEITAREEALAALETRLANPPADPAEVRRLGETYAAQQAVLEALYARWEDFHKQLEG
jgi:ATP-binding cassette subfamily F protein 3